MSLHTMTMKMKLHLSHQKGNTNRNQSLRTILPMQKFRQRPRLNTSARRRIVHTHTSTTSDIIAEIKPEMLERLKAIDMPKEAYPQNGKYGKDNYRITSEKGVRIEVQLKQ